MRVDTGVREGDAVTPFYDPMIAKVIAHGATREQALDRLADALEQHGGRRAAQQCRLPRARSARADGFRAGEFDTGFIDGHLAELGAVPQALDKAALPHWARANC